MNNDIYQASTISLQTILLAFSEINYWYIHCEAKKLHHFIFVITLSNLSNKESQIFLY